MAGPQEVATEVLVVGGGLGGVAAALAAARLGATVLLSEEAVWIGGQLTAQAVSAPDEHPWIESFGATRSYRQLRDGIRQYYRTHYPLRAGEEDALNPGGGWVSRLCHEPRVALAVLEAMLAPHRAAGRIQVWTLWRPVAADVAHDRVRAVQLAGPEGQRVVVHAPLIIDATEMGELLPLVGAEYVRGAEAAADTGEPDAPSQADPDDVQAFTVCFVMDFRPGEDHTIQRPAEYGRWQAAGHLSWEQPNPRTLRPRRTTLFPHPGGELPLWTYRRILDRDRFQPGALPSDLCLVNWPQNDFTHGHLLDQPEAVRQQRLQLAKSLSLSLLHWLQTEAPRPDGGVGWPGLRLRPDVVGTADGLAMLPYVRESRRIVPVFRVLQQHIAAAAHPDGRATPFPDSVGIGLYRIDLHPSASGRPYLDRACCPFQIPLGALLPIRLTNLLAGAKNIGATHIAAGALRVHPVEWNVGESAGALAAYCLRQGLLPHQVRAAPERLQAFQEVLQRLGVPLAWPYPHPV